jgi:aspartate ammonia-lyase
VLLRNDGYYVSRKTVQKYMRQIAKKALKQNKPVREVILEDKILSPEVIDRILDPIGMTEPGFIR